MGESRFAVSECPRPVGAEVFDTTTDPAIELPVCSHGVTQILTYKLAVSHFLDRSVGPQVRQAVPDIGTAVAHRGGFRQVPCAPRSDRRMALRFGASRVQEMI
jgi:hypothetical protein